MMVSPAASDLVLTIAKAAVIIGLAVYIIFALVVVKQVELMNSTLEVPFEKPVRFLSLMHLLFAATVLIIAILIL